MKYSVIQIDAESQSQDSGIALALRKDIVAALNFTLALARVLLSLVILNSAVTWNDQQWPVSYGLAFLPLCWAMLASILAFAEKFRWKTGGRIMALADIAVSAAVILFFPEDTLPALALTILAGTFLAFRHDGNFGLLCSILTFAALLIHPLGFLDFAGIGWLVSNAETSVLGEMVAFILSLSATFFAILVILHIRRMEAPLTFQQPWERDFSVKLGKHNIEQVAYYIQKIYPESKLVCILNIPGTSERLQIITNSSILRSNIEQMLSHATDYSSHGSHGSPPIIIDLEHSIQIAVESGRQSPIPVSLKNIARALTGLGFNNGVLLDFRLSDISCRLFISTGVRVIGETLRTDMRTVGGQLEKFFANATKWDTRRKEMIALARDLARRDLHDGILQSLAALKMRLVTIISAPKFTSHPEIVSLRKTIDIITLEQLRLRALLHNDEVDDDTVNLVEAIEICLKTLSLQWDISVTLESQELALPVNRESAENIEYLVREAIANAARHDGVKELTLTMALNNGNLMITLNDDCGVSVVNRGGRQTNVAMLESRSLSQRLRMVNGHAFSTGLKDGTLLAVNIPLDFTENE